jgi:hypothetical protein
MTQIDITPSHPIDPIASERYRVVLHTLQRQYGDRAVVTLGEALLALPGRPPENPENAAALRRQKGTYPYPVTRLGTQSVVLVVDIAAALLTASAKSSADDGAPTARQPSRRPAGAPRRGRPRKVATGGAA